MAVKRKVIFLIFCLCIVPLQASTSPLPGANQQTFIDLVTLIIAASSVAEGTPNKTHEQCRQHAQSTLEILNRHLSGEVDEEFVMDAMPQVAILFKKPEETDPLFALMQHTHNTITAAEAAPSTATRQETLVSSNFFTQHFATR